MKISVTDGNGRKKILTASTEEKKTLLSILREHQIYIDAPCNGRGTCGQCRVRYRDSKMQEEEFCLACRTIPEEDCAVQITCAEVSQIRASANRDGERNEYAAGGCGIAAADRKIYAAVGGCGIAAADRKTYAVAGGCGIAIDIGTTTLAAALLDLSTGTGKGVVTAINRQRMYGADVIARIQAANEGKLSLLQKILHTELAQMITALLAKARRTRDDVRRIVIAGNTAMCHLLLGYSCRTLGVAPFTPVDISLTKRTYRKASVVILPGISAFVGADIVSGLYAAGIAERGEDTLFLDIGTNGEMVIGCDGGFLATAAAAGPVFEGGGISCGVPGVPGAISHISLHPDASVNRIERIEEGMGNGQFCENGDMCAGLCGSGILDMMGELVRYRLADTEGLLKEPWFSEGVPVTLPDSHKEFRFLQSDIRQFQMGKAAIRAGIELLLKRYYGGHKAPFRICLAGGFGYHMDVGNAIRTGLFPPDFAGRVEILGNSALNGAIRYLLEDAGEMVTGIAKKTETVNLAKEPDFFDSYVEAMRFPASDAFAQDG